MDLLNEDTLWLVVMFLIPGFVALKAYSLLVPSEPRDWPGSVLEIFTYGMVNFGLFFWVWGFALAHTGFWANVLRVVFLFVLPAILALVVHRILCSDRLRPWVIHPTPTGWDHFFGKGEPCWVLFRLKTGEMIGGFYGTESLASSYPQMPDIFVEEVWKVDDTGKFEKKIDRTEGMYVSMSECRLVEFFSVGGN